MFNLVIHIRALTIVALCLVSLARAEHARAASAVDTTFAGDFEAQGRLLREFDRSVVPMASLPDGAGGFLIVWDDAIAGVLRLDHYDVDARRVVGWPDSGRVITGSIGTKDHRFVTDDAGGLYHAWSASILGTRTLMVERLDGNGDPAPGWSAGPRPIAPDSSQLSMLMTPALEGGLWLAWIGIRVGGRSQCYVTRVASNGDSVPGWPRLGIPVTNFGFDSPTDQIGATCTALIARSGERVFLGFTRDYHCGGRHGCYPSDSYYHYAVRVESTGVMQQFIFSPEIYSRQLQPDDGPGVYDFFNWAYQWFLENPPQAVSRQLSRGTIFSADDGDVLFTPWYSGHFMRMGPNLVARPGWGGDAGLDVATAPAMGVPTPIRDGAGGFWFGWYDGRSYPEPADYYVTQVRMDGTFEPGWPASGLPVMTNGPRPEIFGLLPFAARRLWVLWSQWDTATNRWYAQRLSPDQPVPTQVSLVSAIARVDHVSLEWFAADDEGLALTVERTERESDWRNIGSVFATGTGRVLYEDRDVRAGTRYGYRLRDANHAFAETWVAVPQAATLAIRSARASGPGRVRIAFTAAQGLQAECALFDLSGRRLGRARVVANSDELQSVEVTSQHTLAPGLYLVRLVAGSQTAQHRLMITR